MPGAGAEPIWSEPESALGPQTAGAAQKSGGSATLDSRLINKTQVPDPRSMDPKAGRIRIGI